MPPPAQRPDWKHLHLWQIQPVRDALVVALCVGVVWLGYKLSVVTVPLLLALTLAYLFEPLVSLLEERRVLGRRVSAVGIIALAVILVVVPVGIGVSFAVVQGVQVGQRLVSNGQQLLDSVQHPGDESLRNRLPGKVWRDLRDYLVEKGVNVNAPDTHDNPRPDPDRPPQPSPDADAKPVPHPPAPAPPSDLARALELFITWARDNAETLSKQIIAAGGGAVGAAWVLVSGLFGTVFAAFLTGFFFFFFCINYARVKQFIRGLIPDKRRDRTLDLLARMDRVIAGFVRGRLIISFIFVGYLTLAYWAIGVPAPLILGPLVGVLTLIPYAAWLGVPAAMLLMWLDPSDGLRGSWWWVLAAPLAVHVLMQVVDDYFLTPKVQGKNTDMEMPAILFASLAGGVLAGFYGLLIAIPAAACLKILLKEVFWPRFREWSKGRAEDVLPISKD